VIHNSWQIKSRPCRELVVCAEVSQNIPNKHLGFAGQDGGDINVCSTNTQHSYENVCRDGPLVFSVRCKRVRELRQKDLGCIGHIAMFGEW
jgi:hypothetical protein